MNDKDSPRNHQTDPGHTERAEIGIGGPKNNGEGN